MESVFWQASKNRPIAFHLLKGRTERHTREVRLQAGQNLLPGVAGDRLQS